MFQHFMTALLITQEMYLFQKTQSSAKDLPRQSRVEYEQHHESDASYIQQNTEQKHRHDPGQISMYKRLPKYEQTQPDQYEHCLIGNSDHHKNERCDWNRYILFLHIIDLRRLSSGR